MLSQRRRITYPWLKSQMKRRYSPLIVLLLLFNIAFNSHVLLDSGIAQGLLTEPDLFRGYVPSSGSWQSIWNGSIFPGMPRSGAQITLTDLFLHWTSSASGSPLIAGRLFSWAVNNVAIVGMYVLAFRISGSRPGAILASATYSLSSAALLYAELPLAAGYALAPYAFLGAIRLLDAPSVFRSAILGLAAGVFIASTTAGYAYIVCLSLFVLIVADFIHSAANSPAHHRLKYAMTFFGKRSAYLALSVGLTLMLTAYYLTGLTLGTVPLLEELGTATLLVRDGNLPSLPSLTDAVALRLPNGSAGPGALVFTGWAVALLAIATTLLRPDARKIALLLVLTTSLFFASNIDSITYRLFANLLPYFSLVSGAAIWLGLALLVLSLMLATGYADAANSLEGVLLARRPIRAFFSSLIVRPRLLAASALVVLLDLAVLVNLAIQYPTTYALASPAPVASSDLEPFRIIAADDSSFSVMTLPFLLDRASAGPVDESGAAIDVASAVGSVLGGHPVIGMSSFTVEASQGNIRDTLKVMRTHPIAMIPLVQLSQDPTHLGGPIADFELIGTVNGGPTTNSRLEVRLREHDSDNYINLEIRLDGRYVSLEQRGDEPRILGSTFTDIPVTLPAVLRIVAAGPSVEVWLGGRRIITSNHAMQNAGGISASATGRDITLTDLEIAHRQPSPFYRNSRLARLLAIMNTKYVVVQSSTSRIEGQRFAELKGFEQVNVWQDTTLYRNVYHRPDALFLTPAHAIYIGEVAEMLPALLHLQSMASAGVALVKSDHVPGLGGEAILSSASFVALSGDDAHDEEVQSLLDFGIDVPPLLYVKDLEYGPPGLIARPFFIPQSVAVEGNLTTILPRARNFVLEATLRPIDVLTPMPRTAIQFRVQDNLNFYSFELGGDGLPNQALIMEDGEQSVLAQDTRSVMRGPHTIRISAEEQTLSFYLDDSHLFDVNDDALQEIGEVRITSSGAGLNVTNIGVATDRNGRQLREALGRRGFKLKGIDEVFGPLGRDHVGLFSDLAAVSVRIQGVAPGLYRLLIKTHGADAPTIISEIDQDGVRIRVPIRRTLTVENPNAEDPSSTWHISEPLELKGGRVDVVAAVSGSDGRVQAVMLAQISQVGGNDLADTLFDLPGDVPLQTDRLGGTSLVAQGVDQSVTQGFPNRMGFLVYSEGYNDGWMASLDGEQLAHLPVFGGLNGYWIERIGPEANQEDDGRITVEYSPQKWYSRGLALSGLGLLLIASIVASNMWRQYLPAGVRWQSRSCTKGSEPSPGRSFGTH